MSKLPYAPVYSMNMVLQPPSPKAVFLDASDGRYRLRTAKVEDATAEIASWMSDPVVVTGLNGTGKAMSVDQLRSYISGFDNVRKNLAIICTVADNRPIGFLMFDVEPRHRIGSFHILIGSRKDRIGEASYVAIRLALRHMFEVRGVEKVSIEPLSRNRAVVQYCEWLGFRLEGVLKSHRVSSTSNERLDQHVFGMTKSEYLAWLRA